MAENQRLLKEEEVQSRQDVAGGGAQVRVQSCELIWFTLPSHSPLLREVRAGPGQELKWSPWGTLLAGSFCGWLSYHLPYTSQAQCPEVSPPQWAGPSHIKHQSITDIATDQSDQFFSRSLLCPSDCILCDIDNKYQPGHSLS